MTIGERLLKLRKEKNISQEELANELDVSRQTISKWETDQSQPDFDKIIPLCEFFNITSDELFKEVNPLFCIILSYISFLASLSPVT